ncbi:MAG: YceI family protein [Flavobacteriales bacterium]|jgi:polyisoprenoid-binding protein YceI|uniref:YceI family protein n=1 Tax=Candidatus Ulvibacter alkanivorans TaxID=2267620 RepID=UPI000DF25346|nr:YceI family protein [Candidatus Ulvibacter alkanivorans]MCH2489630.1 YceI family protein [Flavobacteriales bacterium]
MKKVVLNIALVAFASLAFVACKDDKNSTTQEEQEVVEASEAAATYTVNTEKSVIKWQGEKPTGSHNGTIQLASGTVEVQDQSIEAGNFTIDMNSIVDLDLEGESKQNLEAHLKGTVEGKEGDFFNVTEYPTATFELTGVSEQDGKTMVSGNLTMKDQTHNVTFPASVSFNENTMSLQSETFAIDRTKWGVNYGSKSVFDNLGDKFINDEIELTIELHASKS